MLRNPIIAGPADHFIDDEGVRRAIKTGVGAVVLKSVNETRTPRISCSPPSMRRSTSNGAR